MHMQNVVKSSLQQKKEGEKQPFLLKGKEKARRKVKA